MSLTFVISLIAGIIAVRNYKLVKSFDLGLISISHFSHTGWMFSWLLIDFAYFNIGYFVDHEACRVGNEFYSCFFDFWYYFLNIALTQLIWSTGWFILFLHAFRLFDFKKRSKQAKVLLGVIFYEITALYIWVLVGAVIWGFGGNSVVGYAYITDRWYMKFLIMQLFFRGDPVNAGNLVINLDVMIIHLFLFAAYFKIKPVIQTREFKISRYIWLFYSSVVAFAYFQFYVLQETNDRIRNSNLNVLNFLDGILTVNDTIDLVFVILVTGFIPVMILIAKYPQAMIMTESQLVNAKNLYKLLEIKPHESPSSGPLGLNAKDQIHSYLEKLPEELKLEIAKSQT